MNLLDRLRGRPDPGQAAPGVRRYQSPPPVADPLERYCLDELRAFLDDPVGQEFLILLADPERNAYVQFVVEADHLRGEVSGDEFLTTPLSEAQRQRRSLLGWAASTDSPNPAQAWPYPVQLEIVASIVARTLVEVFGLSPDDRPEAETAG
jgi:hypothetical protein